MGRLVTLSALGFGVFGRRKRAAKIRRRRWETVCQWVECNKSAFRYIRETIPPLWGGITEGITEMKTQLKTFWAELWGQTSTVAVDVTISDDCVIVGVGKTTHVFKIRKSIEFGPIEEGQMAICKAN